MERLRLRERGLLPMDREEPRRTAASVTAHLRRLLNARQGHAPAAPDYGLPDLTHFLRGCPATVADMEKLIRDVIEKYEPRLANVRVHHETSEEDPSILRFEIRAKLRTMDHPIVLETRVDADGRIAVNGGAL